MRSCASSLAFALVLVACQVPQTSVRRPVFEGPDTSEDVSDESDESETTDETEATELPAGPCPADMVLVSDFCVDRYEAHLVGWSPYEIPDVDDDPIAASAEGEVPQGYISGTVAAAACENAGKRLCAAAEWLRACKGPDDNVYPYGDTYDKDACNTTRDVHPIVSLFGSAANFGNEQMNDPEVNQQAESLDASGANPGCVTAEGVYDMHGNLHEWIDDPNGTFKGGFYVDAVINGVGCSYQTTAHSFGYHDYSTGFRCCADPDADR